MIISSLIVLSLTAAEPAAAPAAPARPSAPTGLRIVPLSQSPRVAISPTNAQRIFSVLHTNVLKEMILNPSHSNQLSSIVGTNRVPLRDLFLKTYGQHLTNEVALKLFLGTNDFKNAGMGTQKAAPSPAGVHKLSPQSVEPTRNLFER